MMPVTEKPAIDFEILTETYGSEEIALGMLETFDQILSAERPLENILDAVLYEDFKGIKEHAHKIKGTARCGEAYYMSEVADALQKEVQKETAILQLKELAKETKRAHSYACELLKIPQEEIQKKMATTYEILDVFTGENEAKDHFDFPGLIDIYGDEEMAFMMIDKGIYSAYSESDDLLGLMLQVLLAKDYTVLERHAHSFKGRGKYLSLPGLISVCAKLQAAAKEQLEEECYRCLLSVIDESLFLERYVNIKKMEKQEPTERFVKLKPDLVTLLKKRDNIPEAMLEIKEANNIKEETPGTENAKEDLETIENQTKSEENNFKLESEESKIQISNEGSRNFHHNFHETTIKTNLEPIPEEKEKEEVKQNESIDEEVKLSAEREKRPSEKSLDSDVKMPPHSSEDYENKNKKFGEYQPLEGFEESKGEVKEVQFNSISKPRENVMNILEEVKEDTSKFSINANQEEMNGKSIETKKEISFGAISKSNKKNNVPADDNYGSHIVISSKKKKKENRNDDDDYPFDSGLKCNMF